MVRNLAILIFVSFQFLLVSGQVKYHEIRIGTGRVSYYNALIVPSGLPGINYSLQYRSVKISNAKQFSFKANLSYNKLEGENKEVREVMFKPYHLTELNIAWQWGRNISVPLPNFNLHLGANLSLNGLWEVASWPTGYHYGYIFSKGHYGSWHFAPGMCASIAKEFKSINLQYDFTIPFLVFGFFEEYQNSILSTHFNDNFLYYATPNTLSTIYRFFNPETSISVIKYLDKCKRKGLKLGYNYSYWRSSIHKRVVKKQIHSLTIGVIF